MSEQDRRQLILEGALKVFSEQGYHKASIKEIAKAAGIKSPALIYHYFADKKAVLAAILTEMTPFSDIPIFQDDVPSDLLDRLPDILLPMAITRIFAFLDNPRILATIRVFISEAARMDEVGDAVAEFQQHGLRFLSRYIQHHIDSGYFRPHDTATSSRAFIGMMLAYVLGQAVFPGMRDGFPQRDAYIDDSVRIFVKGLRNDA